MIWLALAVLAAAWAASWWGTGWMLKEGMAGARGGGLAIATVVLAGLILGVALGWTRTTVALALVPSGAAVALVGWRADRSKVRVGVRLAVHLAAAAWVVYCFGPLEPFASAGSDGPGILAAVISVAGIVWIANLFDLMDGIDGLAASEALTVALLGMLLCWRAGDLEPAWVLGLLAVAGAGFLPWNWSPARIHLGQVGSVFLGFMLASVGLLAHQRGDVPAPGWLLLLGVFIVDTTVTVAGGVIRRAPWAEAKTRFAYRRAIEAGRSPHLVSDVAMGVNAGLGLLVWLAVARPGQALWAFAAGLLILLILYLIAGRTRPPPKPRPRVL